MDANENKPSLCYTLKGDEEPQQFLTPHYLVPDEGANFTLMPASPHLLVIDIFEEIIGDGGIRLSAIVLGRDGIKNPFEIAGSISYTWVSWRLDVGLSDKTLGESAGFQAHGTSKTIELPPGVYNVILQVMQKKQSPCQMRSNLIIPYLQYQRNLRPLIMY